MVIIFFRTIVKKKSTRLLLSLTLNAISSLNYSGLDLLLKRYVIKNYSGKVIERVQEMFLGIALHLAMPEKEDRLMWVRRIYDLLSKLEVTMATPYPL